MWRSVVSVLLVTAQQLCFCFLLCNTLHEHPSSAAASYEQTEIEVHGIPSGDCDESQHFRKCDQGKISRIADTEGMVPPATAVLPERFRLFTVSFAASPARPEPELRPKLFLQQHALRC